MENLISVIIPVYNTEKYLHKCVDSVLHQTYQNLQIILVDDGSTDASGVICDSYAQKDRRVCVVHKRNGGLSSARNAGLAVAKGDYIGFVDSDDYISGTMYEELLSVAEGTEDVCCARFVRVNEHDVFFPRNDPHAEPGKISAPEYLRELLLHVGDVSVCTKLFPREILQGKRFDERRLNEDLLFMVNLIPEISHVVYTGKVGYYYLTRSGSTSSGYGKAVVDMAINARWVNEMVQEKFPEMSSEGHRFALFQNMAFLLLVPHNLRNKCNQNYVDALEYLRRNFKVHGIRNPYLTKKNKMIILGLTLCPEGIIRLFQRKHRK